MKNKELENKLLPCPFCGTEPKFIKHKDYRDSASQYFELICKNTACDINFISDEFYEGTYKERREQTLLWYRWNIRV